MCDKAAEVPTDDAVPCCAGSGVELVVGGEVSIMGLDVIFVGARASCVTKSSSARWWDYSCKGETYLSFDVLRDVLLNTELVHSLRCHFYCLLLHFLGLEMRENELALLVPFIFPLFACCLALAYHWVLETLWAEMGP